MTLKNPLKLPRDGPQSHPRIAVSISGHNMLAIRGKCYRVDTVAKIGEMNLGITRDRIEKHETSTIQPRTYLFAIGRPSHSSTRIIHTPTPNFCSPPLQS